MTTVRRRILRQARTQTAADSRRQQQIADQRAKLQRERASLDRWMTRLKRAFHAVEKQQRRIAGLERNIRKLEQA